MGTDEEYMQQLENELQIEKTRSMQYQKDYGQISMFSTANNTNLIQWQLSLDQELERIDNLLRSRFIAHDEQGNEMWKDPEWPEDRVLTEHGVKGIMHIINFLVTKNILLSNFDKEVIKWKMQDFGKVLVDDMFLTYEDIFYRPTIAELLGADMKRVRLIEKEMDLKIDEEAGLLYQKLRTKFNELYVGEIDKINKKTEEDYKQEAEAVFQKNCRKWPMIVELVMQTVHATYNRSLNGGERDSLRTARHVSQSINPQGQMSATQPYQAPRRKAGIWGLITG